MLDIFFMVILRICKKVQIIFILDIMLENKYYTIFVTISVTLFSFTEEKRGKKIMNVR